MKARATKPDDLSLIPRDPLGGRRALTDFTLESACAYEKKKVTKASRSSPALLKQLSLHTTLDSDGQKARYALTAALSSLPLVECRFVPPHPPQASCCLTTHLLCGALGT